MKPDNKTWDWLKKQMHDQMPGLDWTKIPEFGATTWGQMLDGFLDEVIPKLLATQKKQIIEEENKKHLKIYKWLLGYTDFPDCSRPPYYKWRTELRTKLPNDIIESLEGEA